MKIISPIAIDMGAKYTGVYYAKYQEGTAFEQIEKQGQVLVYGNYTPLLKERTANRHTRRGYQRKKLAKRLLTVILEAYFDFPAKEHSQTIGFLLNRRGFTRLEGEYSEDYLRKLPDSVWNELPGKVHDILGDRENIAEEIEKFVKDQPEKIKEIHNVIDKKLKDTKRDLVYYRYVDKISKGCEKRISQEGITEERNERHKLSRTSKWIVERLIKDGAGSLREVISEENTLDLLNHLNNLNEQQAQNLKNQLRDVSAKQEQAKKEVKESIWDFSLANFDLDEKKEAILDDEQHKNFQKTHLHHFCYAVHKINDEIVSGSRHRSKFFEEIKDDLTAFDSDDFIKNKHSPEYLKKFVLDVRSSKNLNIDKLSRLVCHISNLELKPLRAYFDDKAPIKKGREHQSDNNNFISHKGQNGDRFCNEKLSRIVSTWFLKNWVVNAKKDGDAKVKSYQDLKSEWKKHRDKIDVVAFWLATNPELTIPPYQSMTNRRPPKCQSLILNLKYLAEHYPAWKCWLEQLQSDETYWKKLQDLRSHKGKRGKYDGRLIDDDRIALRELQFILDTTKKRDPFKLNEIWSIHHRLQQICNDPDAGNVLEEEKKEWEAKLKEAKAASKLPESLKGDLKFDKADSFGHFINKYYQTRKRVREGRYFIHQSRKNHWMDKGKLFMLCTHKPRQKKHQMLIDLAAILGVDDVDLKEKVGSEPEKIEEWFKDIEGMKTACNDAAKAQKKHRGRLRIKIGVAQKEVKTRGAGQIDDESKELFDLDKKCKARANDLVGRLCTGIKEKEQQKKSERFNNVFSFAQINNILFEERAGFSKTCPVCSTDNGLRMRETNSEGAQASRLPALSIRLIDGLVMRICDAVSRRIANTCWNSIKDDLAKGREVRIPLILEQNRFEFEPNLAELKKRKKKEETDDRDKEEYEGKEKRIKEFAKKICAYYGTTLSDNGEFDHIIPQASRYGTLNDEGNLIYVSRLANQGKTDQAYYLRDLHTGYKARIFPNKSDDEIKKFIYCELEGKGTEVGHVKEGDNFEFGRYYSFINLNKSQQIAFRHALFLDDKDPLKEKVISALQNRNRAIVNGTQRYMAQCIADKLYKMAKGKGKENKIVFDYFEYASGDIYDLRKYYAEKGAKLSGDVDLETIAKQPGEKQELQSHLMDAQVAFLLAAGNHQYPGSVGLKFKRDETVKQGDVDTGTGEFNPTKFFDLTKTVMEKTNLNPKSSNERITDIEKSGNQKKQDLSKVFKRYVFKQNAIGERYKPIVEFGDKLYLGYPETVEGGKYCCHKYCIEVTGRKIKKFKEVLADGRYYDLKIDNEHIKIWTIKRVDKKYKQIDRDSHKYFSQMSKEYTNEEKTRIRQIKLIVGECRYYVARTEVVEAPNVLDKTNNKKYPFYKNWRDFDDAWKKTVGIEYKTKKEGTVKLYDLKTEEIKEKWERFCKEKFPNPKSQIKNKHEKKGKKFTMIACCTPPGTVFRINRHKSDLYQTIPLDNSVISKDRSNFLIKHSRNLASASDTANKDLSKKISTTAEETIENHQIEAQKFFVDKFLEKNDLSVVEVRLNSTSADIRNFPLSKFKSYFNKYENDKKSIIILTEKTRKREQHEYPVYACKEEIDKNIQITTRDGRVKNIKINGDRINGDRVDFSLPFRKDDILKLIGDSS